MRIALITADFAPNIGGVASHVVELGRALIQLGEEVHVITLPLGNMRATKERWQGMTVHRPNIPRLQPFYNLTMRRWLKRFCRETQPDIIHVHGIRPLEATRGLSVPVLFTNHTSGFLKRVERGKKEHQRIAKRLSHIAHILAPSHELCDATATVGYRGPINFISNGVDIDRFSPNGSGFRQKHQISGQEVTILLARRLVEKNGVTVFAQAIATLHDLPVRIIFAGDGTEQPKVENIIQSNGLMKKSIFLGSVPNPDMPDIYRAADISVLPSFMEATSITGLESMACGVPLVGTSVGGIPTLIDDQKSGLLVPAGNPEALGEAMKKLVLDPELRKSMGAVSLTRARELFSWQHIATETLKIYRQHGGSAS